MHLPAFTAPIPLALPQVPTASRHRRALTPIAKQVPPADAKIRLENAPGNFHVANTCIDCDTCRWLSPETFGIAGPQAHVHTQPESASAQLHALRAAVACPTGSIRTVTPHEDVEEASMSFPISVSPYLVETPVDDVYFNGYTAVENYGSASWLVLHRGPTKEESFAVMFDSPRYDPDLEAGIRRVAAQVGGVKYMVLSHKDDVAHHDAWAQKLGVPRIIHEKEVVEAQGTHKCEIMLSDEQLKTPYKIVDGMELIHVPGHSVGSICLLHHPTKSLFTGDHLVYMPREGGLGSSTTYCSQSWSLQIANVRKLADLPFLHGWPGHLRHFHFRDENDRREGIEKAVEFMSAMDCALI